MNSDPLNELWQQQPLPPAQAYREINERSYEMHRKVDQIDGARISTLFVGFTTLLICITAFDGFVLNCANLAIRVPLAVVGLTFLIWPLSSWMQRRRLRRRESQNLLCELERGGLRLRQNQWFYRWVGWFIPILFFGQGVWLFWPQARAAHVPTAADWVWSGSFMLLWLVLAFVFARNGRTRRREFAARLNELTALRDELAALHFPEDE